MRRAAKWFLGAIMVMIAGLAAVLSTTSGQSFITRHAAGLATDGGVTIGKLDGSLFGTGALKEINISDAGGRWLNIHGISYEWAPSQLLFGRLAVSKLHIEGVTVFRAPSGGDSGSNDKSESSRFALPLAIHLGELVVRSVDLGAPVLGEAVSLEISGNAEINDPARASHARMAITRLDGVKGNIVAAVDYVPEKRGLELKIDGDEPQGGTVSKLLGLATLPALSLRVHGSGVLDSWRANVSLAADGTPFVAGAVRLDAQGDNVHRIDGKLAGYISRLVPSSVADLLAERVDLAVSADVAGLASGTPRSISNAAIELSSDAMRLNASGGADLTQNYVHGRITGLIGRADGRPLTFPIGDGRPVTLRELNLQASLPDVDGPRSLTATAGLVGIDTEQASVGTLAMVARAVQRQPKGQSIHVVDDISITLSAGGITGYGDLGGVLGSDAKAAFHGAHDGAQLLISALTLDAAGAAAKLSGTLDAQHLKMTSRISVADLSRYATLAKRPLKGGITLDGTIDGDLGAQTFVAKVGGESRGIESGIAQADGLLKPQTTYAARIERRPDGTITLSDSSILNPLVSVRLKGGYGPGTLAASAKAELASLDAIDARLKGKASLSLDVDGPLANLTSRLSLLAEEMTFDGKPVRNPKVAFAGTGPQSAHSGRLTISGTIANETVRGSTNVLLSDSGTNRIDGLDLEVAGTRLAGDLAIAPSSSPTGRIRLDAQNLGRVGRAIGMQLKGRLAANVELSKDVDNGVLRLKADGDGLVVGDLKIDAVRASGSVSNYLDAPNGTVALKVSRIVKDQKTLGSVDFDARLKAGSATFKSTGSVLGGAFTLAGTAQSGSDSHDLQLETVSFAGGGGVPKIVLSSPSRISLRNGTVATKGLSVAIGGGTLRVAGSGGGKALDLSIDLKSIPADLAAAVAPELGVKGTINGNAAIKGTPAKPHITANVTASGISIRETRDRQLPSMDVSARVTTAGEQAKVAVRATARGGLNVAVDGGLGLDSAGRLALDGQGKIPLALANVFIADRSARIGGVANLYAKVSGTLAKPQVDGRIAMSNATFSDPGSGLDLNAIDADAGFTTERVELRKLVAKSKKGGQASANGEVLLRPDGMTAVNVGVQLSGFKFGDQNPVSSELDGKVTVSGPLTALEARGDVLIKRMDVTVPNQLPQSVAALDIRHVNAPKGLTREEALAGRETDAPPGTGAVIALLVDVQAYDRIFVRGRGVDAQLGGLVKIRGTAASPSTDGRFSMTRGRLSIIGRQLDFTRGNIVFMGSLEPTLDMEATANVDGTTVIVTVSGAASNPQFKFSSSPELPEDEIVSLMLFNKSLASLSATQLVTLAGEIDKIGGLSSGPGTLDKMKSALGIDVLDISTDKNGNTQATAGSYINDKTYVGVKQGMSLGNTRIVIDHNLTKHLKAKGEMGTDGDSKLGLGIEWDY